MRKKVLGIIFAIFLILPCFFLISCGEPKETKMFISVKTNSIAYDYFSNNKFNFEYGDLNIYNISLVDFKIMVKYEDGSVTIISHNDENLKLELVVEESNGAVSIGEYSLTISYKTLTKTYPVFVSGIKLEKPSLIVDNLVYDGLTKYPEISNYNFNDENSGIIASGDLYGIDAREYLVTFSLLEGYTWIDGTNSPVLIPWEIAKRKITQEELDSLNFKISGESTLETTYNGEIKTLETSLDLPEYLVLSGETSASLVGNYVAEIEIKENYLSNYEFAENINTDIQWKISKIKIDIPKLKNFEIEYYEGISLDKLELFNLTPSEFEDWKNSTLVLATGFNNLITSVGNYTFNFRIMDKAHYMWSDGSTDDFSLTFKVKQIDFDMAFYDKIIEIETTYNANNTLKDLESALKTKISEVYSGENLNINNFKFDNLEMLVGDVGEKQVKAVYAHNENYNQMEFDVKIKVVPYEIDIAYNISWFTDRDCNTLYENSFVYNSFEQSIYAGIDKAKVEHLRAEVGEDFELEFEYIGKNFATNFGEYSVLANANIKENSNIKAKNYKILNMETPKTWDISKAIFNPNICSFIDWAEVELENGKYRVSYTGESAQIIIPKINYKEILGVETSENAGINISVSYYQNGNESLPINAGIYEVRFNFSVLQDSNYKIESNNYILKELIVDKAVISNFEMETLSLYLGEKLKDKNFDVSIKDKDGNMVENASYKFKNTIDGERIPTADGTVCLELVHDNFKGEFEVAYLVEDIFEKIIVRDKVYSTLYREISGKEFYELNAYNLDKIYELYFKSGYSFKVYNAKDLEVSNNILDFTESEISNYKIKDENHNIFLSVPNFIFQSNAYSALTYFGNLSETVEITAIAETSTNKIYDIKYFDKGTLLENSEMLSNAISWEDMNYILSYEISSNTKSLKISLDDVFITSNLLKVKLFDKNNEEIENNIHSNMFEVNPKEVSRVVVTYTYGEETSSRTALDLWIVDKTMISKIIATKLLFNAETAEQNLERSILADYLFESNSSVLTQLTVLLKEEFENLGYVIKLVNPNGTMFNFGNQENNNLIFVEIYNGIELIERRSVLISYNFEFEKIQNGSFVVDEDDFYYSVTASNNLKLYINNSGVYEIRDGELNLVETKVKYDEHLVFYNLETRKYSSFKDDETGEFNVIDNLIISKTSINIFDGTFYEIYDENYNKTGKFASLNKGILEIYELLNFDKNLDEEFIKYYFVSDRVSFFEDCFSYIYIENSLGYMAPLGDDLELEIKIPIANKNENIYFVIDYIFVEIK